MPKNLATWFMDDPKMRLISAPPPPSHQLKSNGGNSVANSTSTSSSSSSNNGSPIKEIPSIGSTNYNKVSHSVRYDFI